MKKTYLVIQIKDKQKIKSVGKTKVNYNQNKSKKTITDIYWNYQLSTTNENNTQQIYEQLTDLFFYEDIYIYSKEELFIDITNYLTIYNLTAYNLALKVKNLLYKTFKITVSCGIGSNLFLAKTACNIVTKQRKCSIVFLTEKEYICMFSNYENLTDFWQISRSMKLKLNELKINTMEDIRNYDYHILYQHFGYNAEYLINHAMGLEPATLQSLEKTRLPNKLVAEEVFQESQGTKTTLISLNKLIDYNILKLIENNCQTRTISLSIKYSYNIKPQHTYIKNLTATNSYQYLKIACLNLFKHNIDRFIPIEKITISFDNLSKDQTAPTIKTSIKKNSHSWKKKLTTITRKWIYPPTCTSHQNFSFKQ